MNDLKFLISANLPIAMCYCKELTSLIIYAFILLPLMSMNKLRLLLLPFSLIFAVVLRARHFLYNKGILLSKAFDFPVIVVGNLVLGGAGKSPMIEYLVQLFRPHVKLAVLSRGYGRASKGFFAVRGDSEVAQVGDEPLQIKQKFPEIDVVVCENRVEGIDRLSKDTELVLLDDAFQHRALKGGLNILLFDHRSLFKPKFVLPAGDFRDLYSRRKQADVIVVTKCPQGMDIKRKAALKEKLKLDAHVPVFFSHIHYARLRALSTGGGNVPTLDALWQVLIVSGIANPLPLVQQVKELGVLFKHLAFPDHHSFNEKDIRQIKQSFDDMDGDKKLILTTEKDAMRLKELDLGAYVHHVYYLPIEMRFDAEDKTGFDKLMKSYCGVG